MRVYTLGALLAAVPGLAACFGGSAAEPVHDVAIVRMIPQAASVRVGATVNLIASAVDAEASPIFNKTYVWASSDTAVVESRPGGVFFGKKAGVANVTATVDGIKGTAVITVTP